MEVKKQRKILFSVYVLCWWLGLVVDVNPLYHTTRNIPVPPYPVFRARGVHRYSYLYSRYLLTLLVFNSDLFDFARDLQTQ